MDLHSKLDELIATKNRSGDFGRNSCKGFIKALCYLASLRATSKGNKRRANHWLKEYHCWKDRG